MTNCMWAYILAGKTDIKQIITAKCDRWHERQSPGVQNPGMGAQNRVLSSSGWTRASILEKVEF